MVSAKKYTGHIRLRRLACVRATFEQPIPSPNAALPEGKLPSDLEYRFSVKLRSAETDEKTVRVELMFHAEPDREARQPYFVEVVYLGEFELAELPEALTRAAFARQNAAAILFPYLREAVSSLTARGTFGPLFVPPINVVALLRQGEATKAEAPSHKKQRAAAASKSTGKSKGKTGKKKQSTT